MSAIKVTEIAGHVEFTNVKCSPLDKNFADFEYCYIKAINRSYKYVSLKVNLFKMPVTKVKVNLSLMKRFNGYRPFLYNVTVDACNYLKNPSKNPIAQFLGGLYLPFTNMNHQCPFNHSLILDKLPIDHLNHQFSSVLPFPLGDYAFCTTWIAYDIIRADVKIFFTLS
ncbi:uncharacterized protein Dwil_GK28163 [Drosophila willistoni]|uniref:MD-2-related lipid-recognition domain-containing protein n=1 Tax=Drosophila willistoni TaxID=7260 RepID=A0A0Q9X3K8_DROWI|nr:uncharacterized protein LOC26530165 [Drosophila willistoni]KRF99517.1 uncharacterized protein Dwil_GK28163 [Drosophila willistoni]